MGLVLRVLSGVVEGYLIEILLFLCSARHQDSRLLSRGEGQSLMITLVDVTVWSHSGYAYMGPVPWILSSVLEGLLLETILFLCPAKHRDPRLLSRGEGQLLLKPEP